MTIPRLCLLSTNQLTRWNSTDGAWGLPSLPLFSCWLQGYSCCLSASRASPWLQWWSTRGAKINNPFKPPRLLIEVLHSPWKHTSIVTRHAFPSTTGYISDPTNSLKQQHWGEEPYYSSAYFTTSLLASPPMFLVYREAPKPPTTLDYYQKLNSTDYASVYATIAASGREAPQKQSTQFHSLPRKLPQSPQEHSSSLYSELAPGTIYSEPLQ